MKPSRDMLKIRRHLAKVPVKPTVADELASALEDVLSEYTATGSLGEIESDKAKSALARYRASKTK